MKTITQEFFKEIIMKQFEIAGIKGITFEDLQKDDDWLSKYENTETQNQEWLKWLRKELKGYTLNGRLEKEVQGFNLNYGLKIGKTL